jgi:hypothetical protein
MTEEIHEGLTRREVLKKGAKLGGTLLWVAPVVQAVGMSPAMAQVASEGNRCCLSVRITDLQIVTGDGGDDDVEVTYTHYNCGTEVLHHIDTYLEGSVDGGSTWGAPNAPSAAITDDVGSLAPGTLVLHKTFFNLPAGTYMFRMRGAYECGSDPTVLPHNDPTSTWFTYVGSVVVPS